MRVVKGRETLHQFWFSFVYWRFHQSKGGHPVRYILTFQQGGHKWHWGLLGGGRDVGRGGGRDGGRGGGTRGGAH